MPELTEQLRQDRDTSVVFHDLNGDGLADIVMTKKDASLTVALQKRHGGFIPANKGDYDFYRTNTDRGDPEMLSFADHTILGFNGTARTLFSVDSKGHLYAHTLVSKAEKQHRATLVSLERVKIKSQDNALEDVFITSATPDAGDFIFHLGGGNSKKVTGSVNKDTFYLLDRQTLSTIDGRENLNSHRSDSDRLDFSALKPEGAMGVSVDMMTGHASTHVLATEEGEGKPLVSFTHIENLTGTAGRDRLLGNDRNNQLDGVSGDDVIAGGAGNDLLSGTEGHFSGGMGVDNYVFYRIPKQDSINSMDYSSIDLYEDDSTGEDSYVALGARMDEIAGIAPDADNPNHLVIRLITGRTFRLHDFFNNLYASETGAASYHFNTQDGFVFSLRTQKKEETDLTDLANIQATFKGIFTAEEWQDTEINLYARKHNQPAAVEVIQTIAGKRKMHKTILPAFFELELSNIAAQGAITGGAQADRLTGGAGLVLTGKEGKDNYHIQDSQEGGVIVINNDSHSPDPGREQDIDQLVLPWDIRETALKVVEHSEGGKTLGNLQLQHRSQPDQHVRILLHRFMEDTGWRHLMLHDKKSGQSYALEVTPEAVAWLATGPLSMSTENRLEVLATARQGQILDGRGRTPEVLPSGQQPVSTVIIDRSGQGNQLYGTEHVNNWLEVEAGDNQLYGGRLADEFHSGTGADIITGGEGEDAVWLKSGFGHDEISAVEHIFFGKGLDRSQLILQPVGDFHLKIIFKGSPGDSLLLRDQFRTGTEKVKQLYFWGHETPDAFPAEQLMTQTESEETAARMPFSHSPTTMDNLLQAMSDMPEDTSTTSMMNRNESLMRAPLALSGTTGEGVFL